MADLIDRQAALDCFNDWVDRHGDVHAADEDTVYQKIEALPSVQPEQLGTDLAEVGTDMISRQAAIDAVKRLSLGETDATRLAMRIGDYLERLPSAQPMRKKGEWIDRSVFDEPQGKRIEQWQSAKCSVCGKYHTTPYLYYFDWYDWCPNCGADMRPKRGVEG